MSPNDRTTRPTKPSLALEAAALAYAAALDTYHEERGRLIARHVERTGSRIGSLVGRGQRCAWRL